MASPPQLWLKENEISVADALAGVPSNRDSPDENNNEQQHSAEPTSAMPLRLSVSTPSFEPSSTESAPTSFQVSRASSARSMRVLPSPLNPMHQNSEKIPTPTGSPFNSFIRPVSSESSFLNRIPSEEIRALAGSTAGNRGSFMILYRRADLDDGLLPPSFPGSTKRPNSFSSDMQLSLSTDSKYPFGLISEHGLVAYAYDPSLDERDPLDEEDLLHNPDKKTAKIEGPMSWRGVKNIGMIGTLVAALLCLFVAYPVYSFYHNSSRNARIVGNTKINATGQAEFLKVARSQLPISTAIEMIDPQTPENVKTRLAPNGDRYTLIFSDEFETSGRKFSTEHELESLVDDPLQATTKDGSLVIEIDQKGSSAVIYQQVPLCLDEGGYAEINVTFPHTESHTRIFWSGRWGTILGESDMPEEGQVLRRPVALTMTLGNLYSAMSGPAVVLVDYIRIYQRGPRVDSFCDENSIPMTFISFPW